VATLRDRKELQQMPLPPWEFLIPADGVKTYVWENVECSAGENLYAGLRIIVVIEGTYNKDIAPYVAVGITNIFSFVSMAQCEPPREISHISISDDATGLGAFFETPDPDSTIVKGTPEKINAGILKDVWDAYYGQQYGHRVLLALQWFRKALREKELIDQFIFYFIALEVANYALGAIWKVNSGVSSPAWAPVKDIFAKKIKSITFKTVKDTRNDILHGKKALSKELKARIGTCIKPMRDAIVYLVGSILGLDDTITNTITSKPTKKLPFLYSKIEGSFENLPTDINKLLEDYPEIIMSGITYKYSLSDTGELGIAFTAKRTFKLPEKTMLRDGRVSIFRVGDKTDVIGVSKLMIRKISP